MDLTICVTGAPEEAAHDVTQGMRDEDGLKCTKGNRNKQCLQIILLGVYQGVELPEYTRRLDGAVQATIAA